MFFSIVAVKETRKKLNACGYSFDACNACMGVRQYKPDNGITANAKHACPPRMTSWSIASFAICSDPTMSKKACHGCIRGHGRHQHAPIPYRCGHGFLQIFAGASKREVNLKSGIDVAPASIKISRNI